MLTFFILGSLTLFECSTATNASVPVVGVSKFDGEIKWAFQKYSFSDQVASYSGTRKNFQLKNVDFGPFGASKVSFGFKTLSTLNIIKDKVSIHFDSANNPSVELSFNDIKRAKTSSENNILTFQLTSSADGVHDVYIFFPSYVNPSDLNSVQFFAGNPNRTDQWYYLISQSSDKALTSCADDNGIYACTYSLHGWSSQKFKFENDCQGIGYKIVTNFDYKVLSVKDGSTDNNAKVVIEPFTHKEHQVWLIEESDGGFLFRSKHNSTKCLSLAGNFDYNGAWIVSYDETKEAANQIWYIVKIP